MPNKKEIKISSKVKRALFLKACDYCLDLSKLVLAGVVLACIMDMEINRVLVLIVGLTITTMLATLGFVFTL